MASVCSNCGGTDIEYDHARGDAVCTNCGSVLEDNIIVSEVNFQETASGGSSVIGQFVSTEDGGKAGRLGHGGGFGRGLTRESREITLQNGQRRIASLGRQLQLNQHCIDTAYNFFKMAVAKRLTQGRKSNHIAAACLYLVCRTEGTPHLLLDFSDRLQANVYILGRAYLRLANALSISAPAIDPCLYVHRFAHKLEFGDQTHEVAMTALRLVSRMKRDWIHHGRRPSGLCGAALLVASRLHGFSRNVKDVVRVVRICEPTIKKRLEEFEKTPSGQLTIDEFLQIDLEEESDPPSFSEARKRMKSQSNCKEAIETNPILAVGQVVEMEDKINRLLETTDIDDANVIEGNSNQEEILSAELCICEPSTSSKQVSFADKSSFTDHSTSGNTTKVDDVGCALRDIARRGSQAVCAAGGYDVIAAALGNDVTAIPDMVDSLADESNQMTETGEVESDSLDDLDDSELDKFLLSEEEVTVKTKLWMEENKSYLEEQEAKKEREEQERIKNKDKPPKKTRRRKPRLPQQPCKTAGEAIERMLQEKKISSKINYDVLRDLNSSVHKPAKAIPATESSSQFSSQSIRSQMDTELPLDHKEQEPLAKKQKSALDDAEKCVSALSKDVVIESGPVDYATEYQEIEEEDEYDDADLSTAQILAHQQEDFEEYDDDYQDFS